MPGAMRVVLHAVAGSLSMRIPSGNLPIRK
jgi:hypothetical protein